MTTGADTVAQNDAGTLRNITLRGGTFPFDFQQGFFKGIQRAFSHSSTINDQHPYSYTGSILHPIIFEKIRNMILGFLILI